MRRAPSFAVILVLAPTLALAASAPAKPALRGPAKTQPPAISPIAPAPTNQRARQTARAGGAQCRTSCANALYMCRVDQDESDCNRVWSQCVAACPETSSGSY